LWKRNPPAMNRTQQDTLFTELFSAHRQPIYGYLCRLVGDTAHAEELVQDVFLRAYRALPGLADGSNHRAWLYKIATNASRDWFRRQSLRRWVPFLKSNSNDEGEPQEEEPGPDREPASPVEERLAVEDALGKLSLTYRVPLVLFAIEGLSTAEIGVILGISRSGVKMRLSRARALFQSAYGADGNASTQHVVEGSSNLS
jgi:RNA polymerase sigma factor (sigma-70 family)